MPRTGSYSALPGESTLSLPLPSRQQRKEGGQGIESGDVSEAERAEDEEEGLLSRERKSESSEEHVQVQSERRRRACGQQVRCRLPSFESEELSMDARGVQRAMDGEICGIALELSGELTFPTPNAETSAVLPSHSVPLALIPPLLDPPSRAIPPFLALLLLSLSHLQLTTPFLVLLLGGRSRHRHLLPLG